MILSASFQNEWIQKISKSIGKRGDEKLIEKIIYAFALLEQLKISGLDLVFKGGTSVFLMCDSPRRFSIDIDIIVSDKIENMSAIFNKVIASGLFLYWQEDNERKMVVNAPVGHYKFFYKSIGGSHFGNEPILLDVLFSDKGVYKKTIQIPIKHNWLSTDEPFELITTPTFESILGDKLTAFAPNTTGILFSKNRPVEIIKQLFDIAFLFDKSSNFNEIRQSFLNVVNEEINYRELSVSPDEVLQDAFNTALLITNRDNNSEHFAFLQKGINNIVNFIITPFRIEEAIICASKTAYLTQVLKQSKFSDIARYTNPEIIENFTITQPEYNKLNRLKKTLPEAFYYWFHAFELLK